MQKELLEALENYLEANTQILSSMAESHFLTGTAARSYRHFMSTQANLLAVIKQVKGALPALPPAPQPTPQPAAP